MILYYLSTVVCFAAFLIGLGSLIKIKRITKEIPKMWGLAILGIFFLGLSEIMDIHTPIFGQPAYFIDYYVETIQMLGFTFFLLGLLSYLRQFEVE